MKIIPFSRLTLKSIILSQNKSIDTAFLLGEKYDIKSRVGVEGRKREGEEREKIMRNAKREHT